MAIPKFDDVLLNEKINDNIDDYKGRWINYYIWDGNIQRALDSVETLQIAEEAGKSLEKEIQKVLLAGNVVNWRPYGVIVSKSFIHLGSMPYAD